MKKENCLVSIIVPVYGTEEYLPKCIDSIRKQTYSNIEIILVDDESPDKCPEICDEYASRDSRIAVIHQKNKGVSGARNAGIQYANGEYIMFVDSDDELYPRATEILLNDAFEYNADIVSAIKKTAVNDNETDCNIEEKNIFVYKENESLLLSLKGDRNTNSACAKLFKRSFTKDIVFEEGKSINEDGFFLFLCYLRKPLLVQHDVAVYQYNTREMSASRQSFSEKYLSMLYFCDKKMKLIEEYFPQYIEQAYNMKVRTHLQFLDVLCRTNDKKYKDTYKESVKVVKKLYSFHKPIHSHHKKLSWIVAHNLYPLYKLAVRLKYYR